MVVPFRRRQAPGASTAPRELRRAPKRRQLTFREITHRERMLAHLTRLAAQRRA
jgi:hypothetical protein